MDQIRRPRPIPLLAPGEAFPPAHSAWGHDDPVPGLVAAGGALDVPTLLQAYHGGLFPWYAEGQPRLWWSPDPRMVLFPHEFRLHDTLRKTLRRALREGRLEVRMDGDFERVIRACASAPRDGQPGTWIVPEMIEAYVALHRAGIAHSVETWWDGELAGGLYTVGIGRMAFGESMFSRRSDASKIALAALVAFARAQHIPLIDCQQHTGHLSFMGAREIDREAFLHTATQAMDEAPARWRFEPVYWDALLQRRAGHEAPDSGSNYRQTP